MRLRLILTLVIVGSFVTAAWASDDDFPPYSQPTNFDRSPIEQMRSSAADRLQASGLNVSAERVRARSRSVLPFFRDVLGTTDYATFNQQVIFLGPASVPLFLKK